MVNLNWHYCAVVFSGVRQSTPFRGDPLLRKFPLEPPLFLQSSRFNVHFPCLPSLPFGGVLPCLSLVCPRTLAPPGETTTTPPVTQPLLPKQRPRRQKQLQHRLWRAPQRWKRLHHNCSLKVWFHGFHPARVQKSLALKTLVSAAD